MAEYRRLIGAGCGGVPPSEVDNVIGILLETLESDESTLAAIGLSVAPNANPASSSQTDSQMTLT
ncbi:hypothetical protein FRC02_000786 [Tulasnella sp. 418]|nr:hypothetical protein FRC02_000786 [Tulasnella sp. 418]